MHHYSRALNSILWQHRKRKRMSLDGTVAGLNPNRYVPGLDTASGQHGGSMTPRDLASIYDLRAQYDWPDQSYSPPESWFEDTFQATPSLRIEGSQTGGVGRPVDYEDALMTEELMALASPGIQESSHEATVALVDDFVDPQPKSSAETILQETQANTWAAKSQVDTFGGHLAMEGPGPSQSSGAPMSEAAEASMEPALESITEPEFAVESVDLMFDFDLSRAGQCDLEALVDEAMVEQPDPVELQQRLYDDQMQQLMDPWMMQGPFGPMPGL